MMVEFDEGDLALDLSDEQNEDAISYLKGTYEKDGYLLNSFFRLFQILGIDDKSFINDVMMNILREKPSYNYEQNCFNDDFNIVNLKDRSQIQLDSCTYVSLSNVYGRFYTSHSILNDSESITSNDLCFAINSIDAIYSVIGRVYADLMYDNSLAINAPTKSIHSLGGESRAKKYKFLKNEVLKKWRLGSFHSYAECARDFNKDYGLSTKTIENWLSKEFSNSKERS